MKLADDRTYDDSDPLDEALLDEGIKMISLRTGQQERPRLERWTQALRRYKKRRWKVERSFAWLGNFRRLVVRYEWQAELPGLCAPRVRHHPTEVVLR